jgi:hypothetical protein
MPKVPGNITMEEAHDRKVTHKVIGLIGLSEWKVIKIGTREECLEYVQNGVMGFLLKPMKTVPLSGKDWGILGISRLEMEFGEGYYL